MAGRAALGRALVASGSTIFGLGAATLVVSSVSMGIARVVVTHNKKHTAVACCVCKGSKKLCCDVCGGVWQQPEAAKGSKKLCCDVCGGDKAIRYHPFKSLPGSSSHRGPLTACAMCSATGDQTCLNCLGEGVVNPSKHSSRLPASRLARGRVEQQAC